MSSLQYINGYNIQSDLVQQIIKNYTVLTKNGRNIILFFIAGYVAIFGNEKPGAAAKSAYCLPVTPMKLHATHIYPRITKLMFDDWQEVSDCCTAN